MALDRFLERPHRGAVEAAEGVVDRIRIPNKLGITKSLTDPCVPVNDIVMDRQNGIIVGLN